MNQTDMVLNHMRRYGSITPREADSEYGIMRLGARIWDLKRMGYRIKKEEVKSTNRFGDPVHFARYRLEGEWHKTYVCGCPCCGRAVTKHINGNALEG